MKVEYKYDQDPRYGWVDIDPEGETTTMIVIQTRKGSMGFNFSEKTQTVDPCCICSAWEESECSCPNVDSDYWHGVSHV